MRVEEKETPDDNPRGSIRRRIGLSSAAALVVANMLGVGVFTTSGFSLADLGSPEPVLLAWAVGGLLALCGATSYGALARRIPESGGEYTFLTVTVHPLAGFLAGWVSLLAGFTAPIAAAALGLQAYLGGARGHAVRPEWIGTSAIAIAALMHGLRLNAGLALQNFAVAVKLAAIAAFVSLGAFSIDINPASEAATIPRFEIGAFAVTLVWISFAYSGWNAAVYVAGEVRDPDRNLPRSLWLGTLAVTLVYLGLNAVFVYSAPVSELAGRAEIGAIAAEALGGVGLRRVLSGLVALALFTSISSMVMAGPRVYARMAEDGVFPRVFRAGEEVPGAAIALQAGLAALLVWITGLAELLSYIGFTPGLSAAATVCGLIAVRRREGADRVPIPGYPWIPMLYILGTLGASAFLVARRPAEAVAGLVTMLLGLPLYAVLRRSSQPPSAARHQV
jgi:APA family basic amino acid/polyamine antiporter